LFKSLFRQFSADFQLKSADIALVSRDIRLDNASMSARIDYRSLSVNGSIIKAKLILAGVVRLGLLV